MKTIQTIILWAVSIVSILLTVFAIAYNTHPQNFIWLEEWLNLPPEAINSFLVTMGLGGIVGTSGFSVILYALASTKKTLTSIATTNTHDTVELVAKVVEHLEVQYNLLETKYNQMEASWLEANKQLTEVYEVSKMLRTDVTELNSLERISLQKTLDNPLVNNQIKNNIIDGLNKLDGVNDEEKEGNN